MVKVDHKKTIESYQARRGEFSIVQVHSMQFLKIDGAGDPNTATEYADAIAAIYPVAYTLKFVGKNELGRDHVVMPLEALWWSTDMATFTSRDKSRWEWTLMNMVPDWVTPAHVEHAREVAAAKTGSAALSLLRLETLDEGLCVQTLHVGSYDDEGPTLAAMHDEFLPANGLRMTGHHHEIYLSDARRTPPHKLRTILRQPATREQ